MNYQNKLLKNQVEEVQHIYMTMRGWRHDYHSHLQSLKVKLNQGQIEEAVISFDGADFIPLQTGDKIMIKKAWETAQIIKLSKIGFLETLREKMKGN